MEIGILFSVIIGAVFVNNLLLSRYLGTCKLIDEANDVESAMGVGMTVTLMTTFVSAVSWVVTNYILIPMKIEYMTNVMLVVIIVGIVKIMQIILDNLSGGLYKTLRVFLPVAAINCAVLGIALINLTEKVGNRKFNFLEATANGFGASLGFTIVMVIFAALKEHIEYSDIPEVFKGTAIHFIMIGIMAMAFMGFLGIKI